MQAVLTDYQTAPLSPAEKALFAFLAKVVRNSTTIQAEDVANLKTLGWSEEAIYDAITVCALFHFYNVWIDATGVQDMPAAGYAMSGKRLAERGYTTVTQQS